MFIGTSFSSISTSPLCINQVVRTWRPMLFPRNPTTYSTVKAIQLGHWWKDSELYIVQAKNCLANKAYSSQTRRIPGVKCMSISVHALCLNACCLVLLGELFSFSLPHLSLKLSALLLLGQSMMGMLPKWEEHSLKWEWWWQWASPSGHMHKHTLFSHFVV